MLTEGPSRASKITLPSIPAALAAAPVAAWSEPISIDTYLPETPDHFPAFLETRVYQGSSGRVFPLPFHERISQTKSPHLWQAIHLENEWLRLVILPELGGRIHIAYDKVAKYDMFYRNNVIKPALVGLAGPWISGGIEFNWPQHHRPATFLPTDVSIEHEDDGSVTVWCSDHDPFARMKGMHGIRLRPNSSKIEARVRLYNRSETRQTFLWWANVAAAVNDDYQSFFPTDVNYVADHAKRAIVSFPHARTSYYGIDYPSRVTPESPDADRLDWYRNIPVPTSYMVTSTDGEFFGGYDHGRNAGFVHWASRDISPGKKQWTWGNAPFGWAWDSNLTDADGPYVELMAGVYTDNQPDFAYLAAGETKTFSQFWYPLSQIGPAQEASADVAARLDITEAGARIGIVSSEVIPHAHVRLSASNGRVLYDGTHRLSPAGPFLYDVSFCQEQPGDELELRIFTDEKTMLTLNPRQDEEITEQPRHAEEPAAPSDVGTIDELVQIAVYLDQYRHATRSSEPYWREILTRDPQESRATAGLGERLYDCADYEGAVEMLSRSVTRRTQWAPTPLDGSAHYRLGLALSRLGRQREALKVLARASWDNAYVVPSRYLLAREHAKMGQIDVAIKTLRDVLTTDNRHLQAADLLALLLQTAGHVAEADQVLANTLSQDPLDAWALHLRKQPVTSDATVMLDVALEYAAAGFIDHALTALDDAAALLPILAPGQVNVGPLISYHRAALLHQAGKAQEARAAVDAASRGSSKLTLPSRLDDVDALRTALEIKPGDPLAASLLGHWYYDRRRYADAIRLWHLSLSSTPSTEVATVVHRNLGIASYNVLRDFDAATDHYHCALNGEPGNAKLWFEFDQLSARLGTSTEERFIQLEKRQEIVNQRDDLTVSFAQLLIDVDRARDAQTLLAERQFQPWEGGEGQVLAAWDRAALSLARSANTSNNHELAIRLLEAALRPPQNLGEGRHPLANVSELQLALGDSWAGAGDMCAAEGHWQQAAQSTGDFTKMSATPFSTQTHHAIVALHRLGRHEQAQQVAQKLDTWVNEYEESVAKIDFFATSLPTMLLFIDDPAAERDHVVSTIRTQLSILKNMDSSTRETANS
ncbi:DUF5107 domain-containing protein [Cryobacterium sp. 10C2]|uniref:DUF5107 domain-containing protein n=1 Tax=Cryobacterium sp. 10C2 TaxID=3048576 RepID=UPI002AB4A49D|nr:DUF5107 domain-containing protein [Cryobacterium sp. 10C2]MDY7529993.1 DUF5107 domain-containing protein [Cryobacterium sp. 10C2]MEB0291087.1 DUF5107 domain-containing protein [Cryobacterium sp. 10C2]